MNTVVDILRGARARLAKPEAWIKDFFALDADEQNTPATSPRACRWCMLGAVRAEARGCDWQTQADAEDALRAAVNGWDVDAWNDRGDTTHADVLAAFDRAIEACEGAT
jgi:hypothetical protein